MNRLGPVVAPLRRTRIGDQQAMIPFPSIAHAGFQRLAGYVQ
jgi:hypothetical protein